MWVKICGNTNLQDAALAAELGADALGFVFTASKRQVTTAQVATITAHIPAGIERVGVFSSHDAEEIIRAASDAGLTTVQLHGSLDQRLLEHLAKDFAGHVSIIQTLHWTADPLSALDSPELKSLEVASHQSASARRTAHELLQLASLGFVNRVVVDSKVGAESGGTGVAYDWGAARHVFANAPNHLQLILAGGLTPSNVAKAIELLAPWGVDVSSGLEASPGKKNPSLLAKFIQNARKA